MAAAALMSSLPSNGQCTIASDPENLLDFASILNRMWQKKIALCYAGFICMGLVWLWLVYLATPNYLATASLHRLNLDMKLLSFSGLVPGLSQSDSAGNTEVEFLLVGSLLRQVILALALDQDPAFKPTLAPPIFSECVMRALKLSGHPAPLLAEEILNLSTDTLAASLSVRNIPDTTVFEITEASDRPQVAAKIAKFLAQRHIQNSKDSRLGHMQSAARWLEVQGREA